MTGRDRFLGLPRSRCLDCSYAAYRDPLRQITQRRDELDRQVRELEDWCDRAGVVPVDTVAEVALGIRTSKRCRAVLADVAAGRADLMLIRDISRLSENTDQLHELINEHCHRIAISRDDLGPSR